MERILDKRLVGIRFNQCNLFIGLYCFYMFIKAKEASAVSGMLLLAIVSISLLYFIYIQVKISQPKLLKCLSFLFIYFLVYGLIYIMTDRQIRDYSGLLMRNSDYIKNIAASILPIYPFYYFARRGTLNTKMLTYWVPIFFVLAIYQFLQFYDTLLQRAVVAGSRAVEFTNNEGYLFVSMLPLLFIKSRHKILQLALIGGCAVFIVAAVKRGGILIGGIAIAYYLYETIFKSRDKGKWKWIFLILCALLVSGYYISDFIASSDYFSYRLKNTMEGNMSGRDEIYGTIWAIFRKYDSSQMIFGDGANSSVYYTGMMAHNDWLEILINQGILGIAIYAYYFKVMYTTWRKNRKNTIIGLALGGLFITMFLKTMFSMGYTSYSLFTCIVYGYCMGNLAILKTSTNNVTGVA